MDNNAKTALTVSGVVVGMVGLSFAAVPLYKTFCQVTGWGGTTQVAEAAGERVLDRKITVRFDANVSGGMPWDFRPEEVSQTGRIGAGNLAFYEATNRASEPVVGTASYNVQPAKAGEYFMKVQCFCFTEQVLQPGESMRMPVTYFIDPAIADDPSLDEVKVITLSYTFYRNELAEKKLAAAPAGPDGG